MYLQKTLILCFTIVLGLEAAAQKPRVHNGGKSTYTRERFNHNATRVKGNKAKIVCPIFQSSKYPYHGIGLKLGDPFAITYKFYPDKHFGLVADFGKASSGLYNGYFRGKFNSYVQTDTVSESEAVITPITHKVKSDFIGEIKLLYHFDASKISPGLQVYIGAGWEWKSTRLQYDYFYEVPATPSDPEPESTTGNFKVTRFTQGPQAVIGIEYSYFQLPISAFMELEYFTDIQLDPGWRRVEGGVGLRYVF